MWFAGGGGGAWYAACMTKLSVLSELAGDPAMEEVRKHSGWKPVLATLLALAFCVSIFFSRPEAEPSRVAMKAAPAAVTAEP
jgi:hypothetical protein